MERLTVLCATMNQTDFSKFREMNIRTDAIFSNQCDRDEDTQTVIDGHTVRMISTQTRGVGLNRNIALAEAKSEFVLFADDDVCYCDDYAVQIIRAFEELPQAQMIAFGIDITRNGEVVERRHNRIARVRTHNCLKYGACVLAARTQMLKKSGVFFTTLFGGGCIYGSGEDSLFVLQCIRKGLRVYSHSYVLGQSAQDTSTWFTGYGEKYFFDKGAWLAAAFPKAGCLLRHYFALHFRAMTDLSYRQCCRLMKDGQKGLRCLKTWQNTH